MATAEAAPTIFTATSAYSLAFVTVVAVVAWQSANVFLPKNARWQDRFTWIWLVRIHYVVTFLIAYS